MIHVVVLAWVSLWAIAAAWGGMYSWHYFVTGAQMIGSPQAVHVFAAHPELQMGPLTLWTALALARSAGMSAAAGAALMMLVGVGVTAALSRLPPWAVSRASRRDLVLVIGVVLAPAWSVLAVHYGHLDDVMALLMTVSAMVALSRGRWAFAAVLVAAATGFKPWAAPFAVALLAGPRPVRTLSNFAALVGLPWAYFVIGDPGTLHLSSFVISVAPDSALRVLGSQALTTPVWDRPAQLLLGVVLAVFAVRRRRVAAVPFLVLDARMLLDPGTYPYYASGLIVAALVVDLLDPSRPRRHHVPVPVLAVAVSGAMAVTAVLNAWGMGPVAGVVRAAFLVGAPVYVFSRRGRGTGTASTSEVETVRQDRLHLGPAGLSSPGSRP